MGAQLRIQRGGGRRHTHKETKRDTETDILRESVRIRLMHIQINTDRHNKHTHTERHNTQREMDTKHTKIQSYPEKETDK